MPEVEYVLIMCAETQDWSGDDQVRLNVDGKWVADAYVGKGQNVYIYNDHMGSPIFIDDGDLVVMQEVDVVDKDTLAQEWITAADVASLVKDFVDTTSSAKYGFHIKWKAP